MRLQQEQGGRAESWDRWGEIPYHGHIKVVQVPPSLSLGLYDVDLAVGKGAGCLEVGEDGLGGVAEAAVCAGEEGDADGLVEGASEAHGCQRGVLRPIYLRGVFFYKRVGSVGYFEMMMVCGGD